jgi:hypothetical protein
MIGESFHHADLLRALPGKDERNLHCFDLKVTLLPAATIA